MLEHIEVHKLDPSFAWIELLARDANHKGEEIVRLPIDRDRAKMARSFISRYKAKRDGDFTIPDNQLHLLEELCEEAGMAAAIHKQGQGSPDLLELLPTNVINYRYPERTSFRKSRAARISMFQDEALEALRRRDYGLALQRLSWVHLLDPKNELAFQLKVVCLRTWKKMAECVPVFENWIEMHPEELEPRLGLGEMWLFLDQNLKARDTFGEILVREPNQTMALIGQAQALNKMGEDSLPILRRAWMIDQDYTVEMIEHHFDFRFKKAGQLEGRTLRDIAAAYQIPIKRVLERAHRGVLPMHPPGDNGLLRFDEEELERHYQVLRCVGLEINQAREGSERKPAEADQLSLFPEE